MNIVDAKKAREQALTNNIHNQQLEELTRRVEACIIDAISTVISRLSQLKYHINWK